MNVIAAINAAQSVAQIITQKPGTANGDLAHQGALAGLFTGAAYVAIAAGVVPASMVAWAPMAAGLVGAVAWHFLPDKERQAVESGEQEIVAGVMALPTADSSPSAFPLETPQDKGTAIPNNLVVRQP